MIFYISTSLYVYLPLYIHSYSIRQQPSNCAYKPNTAGISLTSPFYCVFVSLKKCFGLYTGLPLFVFLLFLDNEETDSAGFETRYDYCIRGMGTSFQRNDFWDGFCGQALVMIG